MNKIITISREFGSGGRELGKRLAEALGIAYYDREIITAIAERSGLAERYVESVSEKGVSASYPFTFGRTFSLHAGANQVQMTVLVEQHKIMRELAQKGDCVMVGRCGDVVLREYRPLNLFIYADMDSKIKRCLSRQAPDEQLTAPALKKQIAKVDRQRAKYREVMTSVKWGDRSAYQLCLNTSGFDIEALIPTLLAFQAIYFERGR